MKYSKIVECLKEAKKSLETALEHAEECDDDILNLVAETSILVDDAIDHALENLDAPEEEEEFGESELEEMAAVASEFDKSGDPMLQRQASVLDQILLTIGSPKGAIAAFKQAEDTEVERLRTKYREEARDKDYKSIKEQHDKDIKAADMAKAIEEQVKTYRPLEAPLSIRTCPDHPGAQMARIGDGVYQCDLDKKVYNWHAGFETMKGNKVPGGDVTGQSRMIYEHPHESMMFDTRESKLNP